MAGDGRPAGGCATVSARQNGLPTNTDVGLGDSAVPLACATTNDLNPVTNVEELMANGQNNQNKGNQKGGTQQQDDSSKGSNQNQGDKSQSQQSGDKSRSQQGGSSSGQGSNQSGSGKKAGS